MKKILTSAGALAALAFTTPASAANTASANATVNIVSPLSLTKNNDLDFGTIVGPFSNNTVTLDMSDNRNCGTLTCSGTPKSASFTVTGTGGQTVLLTIPASVTLNGSVSGTLNVDLTTAKPGNQVLGAGGSATFGLGGTLTIPTGTADGVYSNTFTVTANYQ
ncbi:MAG TPA: DUF4402 domain-containing protein [Sphingomicrobium sp.]|nr:DUF4402 domain-containing protein [Sphingomicrobium sp.]